MLKYKCKAVLLGFSVVRYFARRNHLHGFWYYYSADDTIITIPRLTKQRSFIIEI